MHVTRTEYQDRLHKLPSAESLRSDAITVELKDRYYAPPALTNQWSALVAGRDVLSYSGFAAPPIYQDGTQGEIALTVNGVREEGRDMAAPLTYTWYPGRIERQCTWLGLSASTRTALSVQADAVLSELILENPGDEARDVEVEVRFTPDLRTDWMGTPEPAVSVDHDGNRVYLVEEKTGACAAVGTNQCAAVEHRPEEGRLLFTFAAQIAPGKCWRLQLVHVLAGSYGEARHVLRGHLADFAPRFEEVQRAWEKEWRSAFTPNSGSFSGYLPVLETSEPKLNRLYYMSIMNLLYCKRTRTFGTPALVYATGMPSSQLTFAVTSSFLWDAMMVSGILSLLDPVVMRHQLEDWLESDIHQGYGIDFLSGKPLGFWYAVNDYALIHMAYQYVRYTGDEEWLTKKIKGKPVFEHLVESADYWKHIADGDGLADYGEKENLLECVSTYTHKVASFNAANVWNARTVARFAARLGEREEGERLQRQAERLAQAVNTLYLDGKGFFACKQPDGSLVPVRHCLDFFTVLQCMGEDLTAKQRQEMIQFFLEELKTTTWMHALSPLDPDTAFSTRTDHQDDGAYTTWPAYSLEVLIQEGYFGEAFEWIGIGQEAGLADVTRQGPFGQAYFHGDGDSPRVAGAAAKAPMEWPEIEKPVLISGGKYAQVILEAILGIDPVLYEEVSLKPRELPFTVELTNLNLRGENYVLKGIGGE
ncbi:MAG: hypothetical protein ACOX48_00175 [Limnochordia bacterium]|jgi:hypothetical protein